MAFKDLSEFVQELFHQNQYAAEVEGILLRKAYYAENERGRDALDGPRRKAKREWNRERRAAARAGQPPKKPGFAAWQTPEGRLAKRRARQQARRAEARGDGPKASWRLTPEQRQWARTNGLPAAETAALLGVTDKAIFALRRKTPK